MTSYFLDTSALVKHYRSEAGSKRVDAIFADAQSKIIISGLAIVEIASAFQRLKNQGDIDDAVLNHALDRFTADATGRLAVVSVDDESLHTARGLVLKHNLRTLDALQLTSAVKSKAQSPVFVAADDNLLAAAKAEGLVTLNPLEQSPTPPEAAPDSPPQ
ncbi:MAG: type II toxin-antitoxin system VapC family toxin [Chloroflexi bacterium]|nr:type II toxin-antitoxin system VapC family toxin [Chloroflexota bacterium]